MVDGTDGIDRIDGLLEGNRRIRVRLDKPSDGVGVDPAEQVAR